MIDRAAMAHLGWIAVTVVMTWGCRSGPEPARGAQQHEIGARDEAASRPMGGEEGGPPASEGSFRVHGVACPEQGLEAFRGIVERQGGSFAIRAEGRSIPVWEITQQEAVAPRSPDLSDLVGREVVICGEFDGSSIYRARPAP